MRGTRLNNDIWVNPLKLGTRRRCIGCNALVLRSGGKRGPKPKFCTHKCYVRFHKRKTYLKNIEWFRQYAKNYRLKHPETIKRNNQNYINRRRERLNWKNEYLLSLTINSYHGKERKKYC